VQVDRITLSLIGLQRLWRMCVKGVRALASYHGKVFFLEIKALKISLRVLLQDDLLRTAAFGYVLGIQLGSIFGYACGSSVFIHCIITINMQTIAISPEGSYSLSCASHSSLFPLHVLSWRIIRHLRSTPFDLALALAMSIQETLIVPCWDP
jgi:hypothetical protein